MSLLLLLDVYLACSLIRHCTWHVIYFIFSWGKVLIKHPSCGSLCPFPPTG